MKYLKRGALAVTVALGLSGVAAATAGAHAYHPSDPSYAVGRPLYVRSCDDQVDGNRVRAWYRTITGDWASPDWAPSNGCSSWHSPSGGNIITHIRICVENEGCGPWTNNILL